MNDCETCGHCTRVRPSRPGFGITTPCGIAYKGDDNDPRYSKVLIWLDQHDQFRHFMRSTLDDCPGWRERTPEEQAAWDKVLADVRASAPAKPDYLCALRDLLRACADTPMVDAPEYQRALKMVNEPG